MEPEEEINERLKRSAIYNSDGSLNGYAFGTEKEKHWIEALKWVLEDKLITKKNENKL